MDSRAPDFDSNDRIESSDGGLKGLKTGVFVGKNTKFRRTGGRRYAGLNVSALLNRANGNENTIADAQRNARGYVLLVWTEPGVALGLAKEPVEEGVVAVVVHVESEQGARKG
jgi:hypothetical protein